MPFKAWVVVAGHALGEFDVPPECLRGRTSAEGLEVYVAIGAPNEPIPVAAGLMRLTSDHALPPSEHEE